jgi:hypothetical protein
MMEKGTTFDILVAETAVGYENYLNKKDKDQVLTPDLSQEQMQAMIDRVKKKNETKSR